MSDEYEGYEREEGIEEGFEAEKRLALEETLRWIDALSEEEKHEPQMSMGDRTFTPLEILGEIEESTIYGRVFVRRLTLQRVELASREEDIE